MTTWCVRGMLAGGLALLALAPQTASAQDYPYCLQGRRWGYPGNCAFQTYEQCQMTASGTEDYCDVNPRAAYARQWQQPGPGIYEDQLPPRRRHHRHPRTPH
ncbi:DUF3551 domain-containing protein [Bradyrhizobium sp. SZCCHNS1054]|uniref:DUF3551 domain-containing protein n=1 Tax=Bradyrhizobium sp. SZCCHNS1054 TaxID=3057301 RepID=UPI00291615FD|nr:DUF3551 domain-containing protein [Bradyrhizobium sp. SZCCHNS1054]